MKKWEKPSDSLIGIDKQATTESVKDRELNSDETPREYELKLSGTARDMPAFKRAVDAVANTPQTWQSADMTTRYFDTSEQRLFKKGIAVRVRHAKGKFLQTVKADRSGGGVLNRAEWEQPVKDAEPDLKSLPKAARRKIGTLPKDALLPIIAMEVQRQKTIIRRAHQDGPDLEVEAVIDKGTVQAGDKSKRFAECELELLQGRPADFFQLVTEIHNACPLRLSRTTKSDRGYALLNDQRVQAVKLPKFAAHHDHTISQTLGEIFESCIANIIDNEAAALEGKDLEGVHQMRVSVRRLRSSLSVFKRHLQHKRIAWLHEELKWLGSSFGPAREWDVFLSDTLTSVAGYGIDKRATSSLAVLARRHRRHGYELVRATLQSERYSKFILRLTAFAATEGWLSHNKRLDNALSVPVGQKAATILGHPYRKLLKAGKNLNAQSPEQRHEARIKLKKLRYTVDFLGNLNTCSASRLFLKRLRKLQDQFGHLNDVAQALHLVDTLMQPEPGRPAPSNRAQIAAGLVLGWHARELHAIEETLLKNWNALLDETPPWHGRKGAKA